MTRGTTTEFREETLDDTEEILDDAQDKHIEHNYIEWKIKDSPEGFRDVMTNHGELLDSETREKLQWIRNSDKMDGNQMVQFTQALSDGIEQISDRMAEGQGELYRQKIEGILNEKALWEVMVRSEDFPMQKPERGLEKTVRIMESATMGRLERYMSQGGEIEKVPELITEMNKDIVAYNETGKTPTWLEYSDAERETFGGNDPVDHRVYYNPDWQKRMEDISETWSSATQNYIDVCQEATGYSHEPGTEAMTRYEETARGLEQAIILEYRRTKEETWQEYKDRDPHTEVSYHRIGKDEWEQYRETELERLRDMAERIHQIGQGGTDAPIGYPTAGDWLMDKDKNLDEQVLDNYGWQARFKEGREIWAQAAQEFVQTAEEATTDSHNFRISEREPDEIRSQFDALRETALMDQHEYLGDAQEFDRLGEMIQSLNVASYMVNSTEAQDDDREGAEKERRKSDQMEPVSRDAWLQSIQN